MKYLWTIVSLCLLSVSSDAAIMNFSFSYRFLVSGQTLSGYLIGDLQPNNDTVQVLSIVSSVYSGNPSLVFPDDSWLASPNIASISGSVMDRFGYPGPGVTGQPGWVIGLGGPTGQVFVQNSVGPSTIEQESFSATRWRLSPVPIPQAVWLFGFALGVMGVVRRKISS